MAIPRDRFIRLDVVGKGTEEANAVCGCLLKGIGRITGNAELLPEVKSRRTTAETIDFRWDDIGRGRLRPARRAGEPVSALMVWVRLQLFYDLR